MITSKEDLQERVPQLKKIKPNPNGFKIIDKYNYRIYNRCKFELFSIIEEEINTKMMKKLEES